MVADSRASSALYRAAVDGDELANGVMVADLQPCRLTRISNVLRRHANRSEREEAVGRADFRGAFDRDMRNQAAALAQLHFGPNHAIGSNLARRMDFAFRIDDRRRMNGHREGNL